MKYFVSHRGYSPLPLQAVSTHLHDLHDNSRLKQVELDHARLAMLAVLLSGVVGARAGVPTSASFADSHVSLSAVSSVISVFYAQTLYFQIVCVYCIKRQETSSIKDSSRLQITPTCGFRKIYNFVFRRGPEVLITATSCTLSVRVKFLYLLTYLARVLLVSLPRWRAPLGSILVSRGSF